MTRSPREQLARAPFNSSDAKKKKTHKFEPCDLSFPPFEQGSSQASRECFSSKENFDSITKPRNWSMPPGKSQKKRASGTVVWQGRPPKWPQRKGKKTEAQGGNSMQPSLSLPTEPRNPRRGLANKKKKKRSKREKKKESVHLPRSPSYSRPSLSAPVQSRKSRPSWNPVGACPRGSVRVASREHSALLFLGQNPVPCMSDRSRDTQLEIKEKGKEESPGRRLSLRGRASRSRMQPVEVEMGKISTPCSAKSVVVSRPRRNFV